MNRSVLGFVSLAMSTCFPCALHAQSTAFGGAVALGSQLMDRGQAITGNTPILQGAASWTSPAGWSLGVSASTEVRSSDRLAEALAQASRSWSLSDDWQIQASLLYYKYPGTSRSGAFDRTEGGINVTYRDVLSLGLSAIHLIGARSHRLRGAADLSLHWPLARQVYLSVGAGVSQSLVATRYTYSSGYGADAYSDTDAYSYESLRPGLHGYGHAGLLWSNGPWKIELDRILAEPETRRQWDDLHASPWVATISRSF